MTTNDADVAERGRRLRQHGLVEGEARALGGNYRMDALQAALLRLVLPEVNGYVARRRVIAARYDAAFAKLPAVRVPVTRSGATHVYAVYALAVPAAARAELRARLHAQAIETAVYYDKPLHLHGANADLGRGPGSFPAAERLSGELLALPIHPALSDDDVGQVIDCVRSALRP